MATSNKKTRRVTLAADWTTEDGKPHKGGAALTLPAAEARNLVYRGKARFTEDVEADKGGETRTDNSSVTSGTTEDKK